MFWSLSITTFLNWGINSFLLFFPFHKDSDLTPVPGNLENGEGEGRVLKAVWEPGRYIKYLKIKRIALSD
jgi:hypothetical protein